ncbi:MAG: NEW3 domain-containing protein [Candidatus Bipolaricaulia bacterium]
MGRCGTSLLVVLFVCLASAVGATAQVDVSAVSEGQTASPGDFVTAVFEITNLSNSTETFDLDLELPSGLTPLAPPRSVTLDPDASERIFISINVNRQAQAGQREVTLAAVARSDASIRDTAAVAIDVEARPALAVRPPASRQVLPGEAVTFSFEVVNRGNVIDRAVLEARSFRGFSVDVTPSSAELMPGEAITAEVRVDVPDEADAGRDRVTLTARSATFEAETSATVDLTVLPPSPSEVSQDLS